MVSFKIICFSCLALFLVNTKTLSAQKTEINLGEDFYELEKKKDAILLGGGLIASIVGTTLLQTQSPPTLEQINTLDPNDIWRFDRSAIDNNSTSATTVSDILLYSSIAAPTALFALNKTKGQKLQVLTLFAEVVFITTGVTNLAKVSTKRFRPNTYNPLVSQDIKLSASSQKSFFSGHTSNSAAYCFFTASVLNKLYPHWTTGKYITWGTAIAVPAIVAYSRFAGGKHFPTDVITGYLFGAAVGILIPQLHKSKGLDLQVGVGSISLKKTF